MHRSMYKYIKYIESIKNYYLTRRRKKKYIRTPLKLNYLRHYLHLISDYDRSIIY